MAGQLGIEDSMFTRYVLHIHVPAGSIPKDGPSAGVTMAPALVSLLTSIKVRADVAMTGEITLRGNVLPVGGIKEKVLAAKRAGVKEIILPEQCKKDLIEIPEDNIKGMKFSYAKRIEDVLAVALLDKPRPLQGTSNKPTSKKKKTKSSDLAQASI